jgi:DNA-binding CsgD family transcriptional regulator
MEKSSGAKHGLEGIADLRGGPGILILSTDARLLHMNRRGWELVRQINDTQYAMNASGGLLPAQVLQICSEIQKLLRLPSGSKDWEQLEVRRLAGGSHKPVLLRGFGLPGHRGTRYGRVMILLESIGRQERAAQQAQERFRFTQREKTVVQNLAKGWTNKEIAKELGISEPTVKAHIKNIMDKTKCTTRTAIVAQVFHS